MSSSALRKFGTDLSRSAVANRGTSRPNQKRRKAKKKKPSSASRRHAEATEAPSCSDALSTKTRLSVVTESPLTTNDLEYSVQFQPGPVGLHVEPVVESRQIGCRIVRFVDHGDILSQARKTGKIQEGDVLVAVDGVDVLCTRYHDILEILKQPKIKELTFRNMQKAADAATFSSSHKSAGLALKRSVSCGISPVGLTGRFADEAPSTVSSKGSPGASRVSSEDVKPLKLFSPSNVKCLVENRETTRQSIVCTKSSAGTFYHVLKTVYASMAPATTSVVSSFSWSLTDKLAQALTGHSSKEFEDAVGLKRQLLTELSQARVALGDEEDAKQKLEAAFDELERQREKAEQALLSAQKAKVAAEESARSAEARTKAVSEDQEEQVSTEDAVEHPIDLALENEHLRKQVDELKAGIEANVALKTDEGETVSRQILELHLEERDEKIAFLSRQLEVSQDTNAKLECLLQDERARHSEVETRLLEAEKQVSSLIKKAEQIHDERNKEDELRSMIDKLQCETGRAKTSVKKIEDQKAVLQLENDRLASALEGVRSNNKALKGQLEELQQQISESTKALATAEERIRKPEEKYLLMDMEWANWVATIGDRIPDDLLGEARDEADVIHYSDVILTSDQARRLLGKVTALVHRLQELQSLHRASEASFQESATGQFVVGKSSQESNQASDLEEEISRLNELLEINAREVQLQKDQKERFREENESLKSAQKNLQSQFRRVTNDSQLVVKKLNDAMDAIANVEHGYHGKCTELERKSVEIAGLCARMQQHETNAISVKTIEREEQQADYEANAKAEKLGKQNHDGKTESDDSMCNRRLASPLEPDSEEVESSDEQIAEKQGPSGERVFSNETAGVRRTLAARTICHVLQRKQKAIASAAFRQWACSNREFRASQYQIQMSLAEQLFQELDQTRQKICILKLRMDDEQASQEPVPFSPIQFHA